MAKIPKGATVELEGGRQRIPDGAAVTQESPEQPTMEALTSAPRRQQAIDAILKGRQKVSQEPLQNLTDLPGMARSAAMGFALNMADAPESLYRTVKGDADAGGQVWHTEHPEVKEKYMQSVDEHPVANIAGAAAQPTPFGKAKAATTAGKLGLAAGRVGYAGALGKLYGANSGRSDASDMGAAAGPMAVQAGLEVASPLMSKAGAGLKSFARGRALATLSPSKADVGKLQQLGISDAVADDLYKSGAFGPLSNTEGVSKRLGPIVEQRGSALGDYINQIDSATGGSTTQPSVAADRIRQMSGEQFGKTPAFRAKNAIANREADAIEKQYGSGTLSLADSENHLKRGYQSEAVKRIGAEAKGAAPSPKTDALALVHEAVKKQNEDAAEAAASALRPNLKGQFVPLKRGYGRMAEAQQIADKTGGPKAANRFLSPSDYGFGIASGQAYGGSPIADALNKPAAESLTGAAMGLAHRQLRTRGSAAMAHAAYPASAAATAVAPHVNQSPAGASVLADYMKSDEERERDAAANYTEATR